MMEEYLWGRCVRAGEIIDMCLAVPMKVVELGENGTGVCELENIRYDADLSLIESVQLGDYVIVHAGFAIEKLDIDEANERLQLFEDLAETYREDV